LVAMKPWSFKAKFLNRWFWPTSVTINTTYWKNGDNCYMTISTYFLKWKCNKASYGQHCDHLRKKDNISKQKGKWRWTQTQGNVKKVDQLK
jgi:hypothetical protein